MSTLSTSDMTCVLEAFERNRYFYGKLMTVRDFEQEQRYHNGKRWLLNRLLFGAGVLCGLEVRRGVGATTLTLTPGVALDLCGREIIVPEARTYDVADLTDAQGRKIASTTPVRLCITYDECTREPVPALKASTCEEACDYSRIREISQVHWRPVPTPPATDEGVSACQAWLNRQTDAAENAALRVERTTPVWSRVNEVFDVAVKVTARQPLVNVSVSETLGGGTLIEPAPTPPGQFPTPPVSLMAGESFLYVYQVRAGGGPGPITLALGLTGVPLLTLSSSSTVVTDVEAKQREELAARWFVDCDGTGNATCVDLAQLTVGLTGSMVSSIDHLDSLTPRQFISNLSHLSQLLDCVRTQLLATPGSPRPGHALITFKDVETQPARPVGPTASSGNAYTVARGDHVHHLPLAAHSGLTFTTNQQLQINGLVGGNAIDFQHQVQGQDPTAPRHLATKQYVDTAVPPITAGDGLIAAGNVFSVGRGAGITVQPDDVAVRFATTSPQLVGFTSSPGNDDTVSRGDHVHAWPEVTTTGMLIFPEIQPGRPVVSESIDPKLGRGPISVILGLEQEGGEIVGIGAPELLEVFQVPRVLIGAGVTPRSGHFQVGILSQEERVTTIRVRWWAFRPGNDLGAVVVSSTPTLPPGPRPTLPPGPTPPERLPNFDPADFPGRRVDEVRGLTPEHVVRLEREGITHLATLASAEPGRLAELLGVSDVLAMSFHDEAQRLLRP